MEKEEKYQSTSSSSTLSIQSKDKGKADLESPVRTQPSHMIETLHKGAYFKKNIENIISQLQTQIEEVEPNPKKKKNQLVLEQVQVQQAPVAHP